MMNDSTAPRKSHALAWIVATLIAIPVLYVLSIGPVGACTFKAAISGSISTKTLEKVAAFYQPLQDAADKSPWVKQSLEAHSKWWWKVTGADKMAEGFH